MLRRGIQGIYLSWQLIKITAESPVDKWKVFEMSALK